MLSSLFWAFLKELLTGEVYAVWKQWKAHETQQAEANVPTTSQEWTDAARNGRL